MQKQAVAKTGFGMSAMHLGPCCEYRQKHLGLKAALGLFFSQACFLPVGLPHRFRLLLLLQQLCLLSSILPLVICNHNGFRKQGNTVM